jgi:hypothetical protein
MRILALAGLAIVLLLSGCMQQVGPFAGSDLDCSPNVASDVATEPTTLYPAALVAGPSPARNPSVTLEVREGQTLSASATWRGPGNVEVAYDGPTGDIDSSVANTWSVVVLHAPAGNVTVRLDGAPFASVAYTLSLTAVGCTPRA